MLLNEFLPVLHFIQSDEQEDAGGEEDEEAIVEEGIVEDFRIFVQWNVERIEEDVPFIDAEDTVDGEENHAGDDEQNSGAVSVADHGAEHETEHPDEEGGNQNLKGKLEGLDVYDKPIGEGCQP